jgi:transcriptional regulator with XRE-family HTH domain
VRLRGREELGLSRARAAEVIGLVMQQIANYELGVDRISPGRLYRFAQFLRVPVMYFFEGLPGVTTRAANDDNAVSVTPCIAVRRFDWCMPITELPTPNSAAP